MIYFLRFYYSESQTGSRNILHSNPKPLPLRKYDSLEYLSFPFEIVFFAVVLLNSKTNLFREKRKITVRFRIQALDCRLFSLAT